MPAQFCPNCGAPIREAPRFCPECGAALAVDAAATPTARLEPLAQPASPARDRRLLWAILAGIAGVGLLMLLACGGLLLLTLRGSLATLAPPPAVADEPATAGGGIVSLPTAPPDSSAPTPASTGGLLLYEDFSDPRESALTAEGDQISRSDFADGGYTIAITDTEMIAWSLTNRTYSDMTIEADATFTPGSDALVAAGLIFNYQDDQNFYLFSVSNDGYYALELLSGDEWQTLIDWTESDLIGPAHNALRVEVKGGRITLRVNGDLLEATDDSSLRAGDAGLAVSSFDTGHVQVHFDNLLITRSS